MRCPQTRHSRGPARRRPAAVLVEFAFVVLFILAPLLTGMVEIGRAVMVKTILTDAARKGAAAAAMNTKTYTDISNDVDDILNTDHQLPSTIANGKATLIVTVATWNASTQTYGSDTTVTAATFAPKQYDKVSVKVTVNASDVTWFFLNYTNGDVESETVVMMRQ
jgi:Flp pilus assembly protein TadG